MFGRKKQPPVLTGQEYFDIALRAFDACKPGICQMVDDAVNLLTIRLATLESIIEHNPPSSGVDALARVKKMEKHAGAVLMAADNVAWKHVAMGGDIDPRLKSLEGRLNQLRANLNSHLEDEEDGGW